jgi:hypothetical protein
MAITITPAEPRATLDACLISVADAPDRRTPDETGGTFEYLFEATAPEWDGKPLRSHVFNVSDDGDHEWPNLIFPVAGTWTIALVDTSDDSQDQTLEVTVV